MPSVALPNGETIAYGEFNADAPTTFVLVHGNMSSHKTMLELLEHPALQGVRLIAPDMRGFGESTYNTPVKSHSDNATDLKLFCDALDIRGVPMLGWSTGGAILMQLAVDHPGYASKLILLCSVAPDGYAIKTSEGVRCETRDAVAAVRTPMLQPLMDKNAEVCKALWEAAVFTGGNQPSDERWPSLVEGVFQQRNLHDIDWCNHTFDVTGDAARAVLEKVPRHVICGEKDVIVPPASFEPFRDWANTTTTVLEGAGHSPLIDCPDKLAEVVVGALHA